MKAMTVRLDDEFYKDIKKMLIDKNKTFQEYILDLIKKDIKKRAR